MRCKNRGLLLLAVAATFAPAPLQAWGDDGHRIVCEIAYGRLSPQARQLVTSLQSDEGQRFTETCLWADEVRRTTHKYTYDYHFTNIPARESGVDLARDCPENNCATWAIRHYAEKLADTSGTSAERNEALKFLSHFVGDLHQPMHCGRPGDIGGNQIPTCFFGYCGEPNNRLNLHKVWDTNVIRHSGVSWQEQAATLAAAIDGDCGNCWSDFDVVGWTNESYRIADYFAYPLLGSKGIWTWYYTGAREHIERRLQQAGVRLAHLINAAAAGALEF